MPFAGELGKKPEDGNEGILGNLAGAMKFLNPVSQVPALVGGIGGGLASTAKEVARLPTTTLAGITSNPQDLETSPLSFAVNTDLLKNAQALRQGQISLPEYANAQIHQIAPIVSTGAEALAQTGLRGGSLLASGVSQTGRLGGPFTPVTPEEALKSVGQGNLSYESAYRHGQLFPTAVQDILSVAPAARGAAGALEAAGAEGAASRLANAATAAERAPLAPYTVPAKGIYNAIQEAKIGGTAFPRLAAAAEGEGVKGALAGAVQPALEGAAQATGKIWAGGNMRALSLNELAQANYEIKPKLNELQSAYDEAIAAGNEAKAQEMVAQATQILDSTRKQAAESARRKIVEGAAAALPEGAEGVSVNARGKPLAGAGDLTEYKSPSGRRLENYQEGEFAAPGQAQGVQGALPEAAPMSESLSQRLINETNAALEGRTVAQQSLFGAEGVALPEAKGAMKIPEHYTDQYISKAMKGLDTPVPKGLGKDAVKGWDAMMKAWKVNVLPLRPGWHLNNVISNAMGAMLLGEVDPAWFAKNAKRIAENTKNAQEGGAASMGRGLADEMLEGGQVTFGAKAGPKTKFGRALQKSYNLNQQVDDFAHQTVYLSELDKGLARGLPEQEAMALANEKALKSMGDFANMSEFERARLRRVMPFYPWYKHQAKATLRLGIENPTRLLQAQTLSNVYGPKEIPGAEFLAGKIPFGAGKFIGVGGGGLGVGSPETSPLLNPASMGGGVAPPIQWLAAAGGLNLGRMRALEPGPGQSRLSATAGYAVNQLPLAKLAADLIEGSPLGRGEVTVKGDTRAPIISGGHAVKDTKQSLLGFGPAALSAYLTGTTVDQPNVAATQARTKKTEATEKKKAKTYEKSLKRKAK